MSNIKISQLPTYTGNTDNTWLVMNNSGETTTYKVNLSTVLQSGTSGTSGTSGSSGSSGSSGTSGSSGDSIFAQTGSIWNTSKNIGISGSFYVSGSSFITGSIGGNVFPLSINSNTASLDLSKGTFYTLALPNGSQTHISPTNIKPGYTVNLFVSSSGAATVTFPNSVKQPSGSAYIPTVLGGEDILTLISSNTSSIYLVSVKNLI